MSNTNNVSNNEETKTLYQEVVELKELVMKMADVLGYNDIVRAKKREELQQNCKHEKCDRYGHYGLVCVACGYEVQ